MFAEYFVYSVVFLCVFGGVLKHGNQEKTSKKIRNSLQNVIHLINHLLSFTACS